MGGAYCKSDKECQNKLGLYWSSVYVETLQKEYAKSHPGQYTGLNIFGTVQQANGIEGASPGHPVMDRDAGDCKILDEILCIHPTYGTKACTQQLLEPFFQKFPKSKVLQINYDVPCESSLCDSTVVNNFMGGAYCKSD